VTGEDAVKFSQFVAAKHTEDGGGTFSFNGGNPTRLLVAPDALVAFDDLVVVRPGKELRAAKDLRALFHTTKETEGLNLVEAENAVVWTLYDEEHDLSVAGIALVELQEA